MKITRTTSLPAGVEEAFDVIASQEHQEAKVAAQAERSSAAVTRDAGAARIRTEREIATEGMPTAVASMVGSTLTITEDQRWGAADASGARSADLDIRVAGVPLQLVGRIRLTPDGDGSSLAVDADLSCSLPFVGKKIEQAARPTIEESFDLEVQLLTERLRGGRAR
ncbi:MAG TPA: DUF2505 domain-containing protein [Candidatus Janibacter merdipullorum]|nr:DUF2505 domain-containing protein [Candidatus Janibacter merdipullorum]